MRTVDIQEQEIFLQAIEITSLIERKDFLYQACGENVRLRQRVEKLLKLQADSDFILDKQVSLAADGTITTDPEGVADLTGATLGNYHLVRMIGSGGMGDVYLAEQREPICRRVAVKVIKLGMDTRTFVARFANERQALALMDHQGITKVFDAGATRSGRPYFVMELVTGEPITKFCDDHHLTITERLQIFVEMCKAIQHAHQKGLIHRDLKPSNILVARKESETVSKVIDFGVAKAIHQRLPGQTDLTRLACMIGTPEYMSPEQTDTQGNDQDIRTDIYSLGAILYELLTGTTPFELEDLKSRNLLTVREIIQTRAVQTPSSRVGLMVDLRPEIFRNRQLPPARLASSLRGNLDAVVLKCLSKDRSIRYSTVAELIRDLQRHLVGATIEIARHNWTARFLHFAARHRLMLGVGAVIGLFAVAMAATSMFLVQRTHQYETRALAAESLADQRSHEAQAARREVEFARGLSQVTEQQYIDRMEQERHRVALLRAIARFNLAHAPDSDSSRPVITPWLRAQYDPESMRLLPADFDNEQRHENAKRIGIQASTAQNGDIELLKLILEEQREEFGLNHLHVAATLDLLGEKELNGSQVNEAISHLRESLLVRAELSPHSSERVWTMFLLATALKKSGSATDARSYIEAACRILDNVPDSERLRQYLDEFDSKP